MWGLKSLQRTVNEYWDLVNVSEKTEKFCMIMKCMLSLNDVMAVLNMVRRDMFGELLHCQGGYQHDLRHVRVMMG